RHCARPPQHVDEFRSLHDPAEQRKLADERVEQEQDGQRRENARRLAQRHQVFLNSGSSASWACVSARASAWSASHSRRSASSMRSSAKLRRARAFTARVRASLASALACRRRSAASRGGRPPLHARSIHLLISVACCGSPAQSLRNRNRGLGPWESTERRSPPRLRARRAAQRRSTRAGSSSFPPSSTLMST